MEKINVKVVAAKKPRQPRYYHERIKLIIEPSREKIDLSSFISDVLDFQPNKDPRGDKSNNEAL
jgi:hypothetical protein